MIILSIYHDWYFNKLWWVFNKYIKYNDDDDDCDHPLHPYSDVIMSMMVSHAASVSIAYSTVYLGVDKRIHKQRVLMHGHQGWNVRHGLCHIYMRYVYIYIWVVYSLCFFCCLFITVTWWYVWCFEWASGNQEELQACLVTLWLFIISCYSLYKTTLGLLCSWFENNPHFHKYSMDFHV